MCAWNPFTVLLLGWVLGMVCVLALTGGRRSPW